MAKNMNNKVACPGLIMKQEFDNYIKEVEGVTAGMHKFVHKLRKIKSHLRSTENKHNLGGA